MVTPISSQRTSQPSSTVNSAADAQRILNIARSHLGYREGSNNYNKFSPVNGLQNQPWCASFVTKVLQDAGYGGAVGGRGSAAVAGVRSIMESNGRYRSSGNYTPQPGDLIFFQGQGSSHIGMVERVQNGKVYTIEGNTSDMVARREYSLSDPKITGYGRVVNGSVPGDAKLGGPDTLQAQQGTVGDGGGLSGPSSSSSGGAPSMAQSPGGGGAVSGGGSAPSSSPSVSQSGFQPSASASAPAAASFFEMLLAMIQEGASEADLEAALKNLPGLSKKQRKQLAKKLKENPGLAKLLASKPELAKKIASAKTDKALANVLSEAGVKDKFAVSESKPVNLSSQATALDAATPMVDPAFLAQIEANRPAIRG